MGKEFEALRQSGDVAGSTKAIGSAVSAARDVVARFLIRLGATPNRVTFLGFVLTCGAGYCLLRGASQQVPYFRFLDGPVGWWPALAFLFVFCAGACDMLDGAVARVGNMGTRAGGVLDSTVDRFSDMAIFIACYLHFALLPRPNLTLQLLAVLALCNAVLISYVKARAETVLDDCSVGWWLRGERFVAVLIGCGTGHVPAILWQLAISGFLTVWRRITYAYGVLQAVDAGQPPPRRGPQSGWLGVVQIWRHPRGSLPFDLSAALQIGFIVIPPCFWPGLQGVGDGGDPLRQWLYG